MAYGKTMKSKRKGKEDMLLKFRVVEFWRYVAQGKGILQPHTLIDELENVVGDDKAREKLSDGPFSEVLKSAQVISPP